MGVGRRRWPQKPFGKWAVTASFTRSRPGKGKSSGKSACASRRRSAPGRALWLAVPGAGRDGRAGGGGVGQDCPGQQRQLREALTGLLLVHELAGGAQHLFGRERELLDRPAVAVQRAQHLGRQRERRRHQQWLGVGRVGDRDDGEGRAAGGGIWQRPARSTAPHAAPVAVAVVFGPGRDLIRRGRWRSPVPCAAVPAGAPGRHTSPVGPAPDTAGDRPGGRSRSSAAGSPRPSPRPPGAAPP